MSVVRSWGMLSHNEHHVVPVTSRAGAPRLIAETAERGLPSGMQRSYGDVSLNSGGVLWDLRYLDKLVSFDETEGILTCEAGVSVRLVQAVFARRGWMMPVTPGTEYVTIGGAIANDVHGKNHHVAGSIGNHVLALTVARTDGTIIECGPDHNPEWFVATVGGMGLTGVILQASIRLKRTGGPWIDSEDLTFGNLGDFFRLSQESEASHEYSVSWIDVTTRGGGRGIFTRGNTAVDQGGDEPKERGIPFPFTPPISLVNSASLRVFNRVYYRAKAIRAGLSRIHYRNFFYPLDSILNWNRMYGPKGFYQYQSVVPFDHADEVTQEMLTQIARSGLGSFLGVLKVFGSIAPVGMMSFPAPGVTFALDFPERGARTRDLFDRLDRIVYEAGGRIYPAKDARVPAEMFAQGYPRLSEFLSYRDPGISSDMSRRLIGD